MMIEPTAIVKSKVFIPIAVTSCLVFLTGLFTDLRFNDEIFHYWFTLEWFEKDISFRERGHEDCCLGGLKRILTPEGSIISFYTGRLTIWADLFKAGFNDLLWGEIVSSRNLLKDYKIQYVLVQKARIYDDSRIRH